MTEAPPLPTDEDGYELWLRYRRIDDAALLAEYRTAITATAVLGDDRTAAVVRAELDRALPTLLDVDGLDVDGLGLDAPPPEAPRPGPGTLVVGTFAELAARGIHLDDVADLSTLGARGDGHVIATVDLPGGDAPGSAVVVGAAQEPGLIAGVFHLLRLLQTNRPLGDRPRVVQPRLRHRVLAHWDNLDGSIERGYAGSSLWRWRDLPADLDERYTDYARACASIGLNGVCLNNVNSDARILTREYLRKVAALADVFRPYGLRVWLAPLWSTPVALGDLDTADPGDARVAAWWVDKAAEIYELIDDFAGFQVKADSEGRPGPHRYGADHASGANVLADALAPHGGIVLWRAFVYDTTLDADRAKCAVAEFAPLDGRFAPNVAVQAKNGPIDFQPREPFHPLFGSMASTPVALELQVTQEYLGHSTHLAYLGGMWHEVLTANTYAPVDPGAESGAGSTVADPTVAELVAGRDLSCMIAVANTGADRNWCGHHFAQANWYAFGRLASEPTLDPATIADEWIRMTWSNDDDVRAAIGSMMAASWPACIDYMTPLGLHHLSQNGFHYGPEPDLDSAPREDWNNTYFHRADRDGVGFDRSSSGSGATAQYHPPLRERFDDVDTCPEDYLLWFHHVSWHHEVASGRTLIEELTHRYASGVDAVAEIRATWERLAGRIDAARHAHVQARLDQQLRDAAAWRDVCTAYFAPFASGDDT